jgi:CRP/FNR family transcriptional regulator, cyclic AMP receptor protein
MNDRVSTEAAARLVTSVAPRRPLEDALRDAGLQVLGPCEGLSRQPGLLQESPLLQDFTADEADILGMAMLRIRAVSGQVLIAENDPSDWMMLLLSGTVDVGKHRLDAETQKPLHEENARVAVLRPGAVVGEMSMLDGEPRYASCWALGEVEAAILGRPGVAALIREHPAVGAKLLVKITQLLAQRLRNTSNQLLRLLARQ